MCAQLITEVPNTQSQHLIKRGNREIHNDVKGRKSHAAFSVTEQRDKNQ